MPARDRAESFLLCTDLDSGYNYPPGWWCKWDQSCLSILFLVLWWIHPWKMIQWCWCQTSLSPELNVYGYQVSAMTQPYVEKRNIDEELKNQNLLQGTSLLFSRAMCIESRDGRYEQIANKCLFWGNPACSYSCGNSERKQPQRSFPWVAHLA